MPLTSCGNSRRSGWTLIEALACLLILGTLVAGVVLARTRLAQQQTRATDRLRAIRAVDDLLIEKLRATEPMAAPDQALIPGSPDLIWTTRVISDPQALALDVRHVRLSVTRLGAGEGAPLIVLDLLLPPDRGSADVKRRNINAGDRP